MPSRRSMLLAAALLASVGCGPPWNVVQQSGPPSALRAARGVTVFFDATEAMVDDTPLEAELAQLPPDERADLDAAVRDVARTFTGELGVGLPVPISVAQGPPAPGEVRCTARLVSVERGARGPIGGPTRVAMRLDWSVGGQVTDSLQIQEAVDATFLRARVAQRMRIAAAQLGALAARFFRLEQTR